MVRHQGGDPPARAKMPILPPPPWLVCNQHASGVPAIASGRHFADSLGIAEEGEAAQPAHTTVNVVVGGNSAWTTVEEAWLRMEPFSGAFATAYLASAGDGIRSAGGAYQIEGLGAQTAAA